VTTASLIELWRGALLVTVVVSAPFLVAGLVVGLTVAVLQTATQLQEAILTFVPKLAVALLVLALAGHWILDKLGRYTTTAFTSHTRPAAELTDDPAAAPPSPPGPVDGLDP
jgi:flagellar biosynthesis protein FliQ